MTGLALRSDGSGGLGLREPWRRVDVAVGGKDVAVALAAVTVAARHRPEAG